VAEADARKRAAFEAARRERDDLSKELAQVYPEIVDKLVDLLRRLSANDLEVERVNANRPRGELPLAQAELQARGLSGFAPASGVGQDIPKLARGVRLPSFEPADGLWLWPMAAAPSRTVEFFTPHQLKAAGRNDAA